MMNNPLDITVLRSEEKIYVRVGNVVSVDVSEIQDEYGQALGIACVVPAPRGNSPGKMQVRYDVNTHTFAVFHFRYTDLESPIPEQWLNAPIVFDGGEKFWINY